MRADVRPGAPFPDYRLPDHTGKEWLLSEIQQPHHSLIITLARGAYCPKEHRQHRNLVDLYPELRVGYTELVTISTDGAYESMEFRESIGAEWTFLCDPGRTVQKDLDIKEYTDPYHDPMVPHTIVCGPGLAVHRIYNGYWYWGRPSIAELRADLRAVGQKAYFDWDLADPEVRAAFARGEQKRFFPYGEAHILPEDAPR